MTPLAAALPSPGLTALDVVVIGAVFVLILALFAIVAFLATYKQGRKTENLRRRVGARDADGDIASGRVVRLFRDGEEIEAILPGQKKKIRLDAPVRAVEATCKAAGFGVSGGVAIMIGASVGVMAFVGAWMFTQQPLAGLIGAAVVLYALWGFVSGKAQKHAAKFDDQFVDALGLCARSLRAGHTVTAGLTLASQETPEPVKSVLGEIVQRQELGMTLEQALRTVADSHDSPDLKLFAASVAIQVRAGGNLSETTNRLAAVIRDRLRLGRKVRVLIAQTQMSKKVLLALPVIVFGLLNVINPEYMKPMYSTPTGQMMLMIGVTGLLVGTWAMNKMAVIKY